MYALRREIPIALSLHIHCTKPLRYVSSSGMRTNVWCDDTYRSNKERIQQQQQRRKKRNKCDLLMNRRSQVQFKHKQRVCVFALVFFCRLVSFVSFWLPVNSYLNELSDLQNRQTAIFFYTWCSQCMIDKEWDNFCRCCCFFFVIFIQAQFLHKDRVNQVLYVQNAITWPTFCPRQ